MRESRTEGKGERAPLGITKIEGFGFRDLGFGA